MGRVLDVGHLSVRFGKTTVLRNVSFGVERGTSLGILGPNAAGKTVLFRALIGAIPCDGTAPVGCRGQGSVHVPTEAGSSSETCPLPALTSCGRARRSPGRRAQPLDGPLDLVGVPREAGRTTDWHALGGDSSSVCSWRSRWSGNPNVLLLDEPTAGVDEPGQERLNELMSPAATGARTDHPLHLARAVGRVSLRHQRVVPRS